MVYTFAQLENLGRLGNQLWQIASTIGIARKAGDTARFRPDWEYRPYFSVPGEYFGIAKGAKDHPNEFLQNYRYWWFMKDEILRMFRPNAWVNLELECEYADVLGLTHTTALHVRRGDYVVHHKQFPPCSTAYYNQAMDIVLAGHPDTTFVVFSDDINWCRKTFRRDNMIFIEGTPRPIEVKLRQQSEPKDFWDLFLMARCDEHIISNSTFSWWGAVLAGNESPIYPNRWFTGSLSHIDWKNDVIFDTWREVPC